MHFSRMSATGVAIAVFLLVASTSAPAMADGPVAEGVPSFGESAGCGALDGVGGPRMPTAGFQSDAQPVYGPWGDFFGRTIGDVRAQLVKVHLPGQSTDLWIHKRALPAFEQMLVNLAEYQPVGESYQIRSDTWSFNPATIPPTTKLSFHGIGASIDVNSATNPYRADNVLITDMPGWFVDAWRDAGWCWGGDWQTIKDPMHFSWMGPIHTPGYDMSIAPPQPPRVAYSNYSNNSGFPQVAFDVVFNSSFVDEPHFAVDLDADGAADVVRLRDLQGGRVVLEVSRARHNFTRSTDWATTAAAPADPDAPVTLADVTGDARPDLVYLGGGVGENLSLEVFALIQDGLLPAVSVATSVPVTDGDVYLFDDFDMDGVSDLYVVRPGSPGTVEVWLGPDFVAAEVSVGVDLPADTMYATGDRDLDGSADLYALAADGGLRILIGDPEDEELGPFEAVGSIAASTMGLDPSDESLFVDDLDGDGHPDLLLIDADGDLRMRRGGFSTHDPGVWFVVESEITFELPPAPGGVAETPPSTPCPDGAVCDSVSLVGSGGQWHLPETLQAGAPRNVFYFGNPGDVAFMGDWNGDGVKTPGLYRQSDGYVYLRNSNTQGNADITFFFGNPGDVPIAGDFDDDGDDTVSIYRPSQGRFFIINELGEDGGGLGAAESDFYFGNVGDAPFVGDFDADGVDTIGLYRRSTGYVYFRNSLDTGVADFEFYYGNPGDIIMAGDWDGDGDDTVAVYRPSSGRLYLNLDNAAGAADYDVFVGTYITASRA